MRQKFLELKWKAEEFIDGIKADPRKALIMSAVVIFMLGVALGANAYFKRGEALTHMLAVCLDKQDALAVAKAGTWEQALAAFDTKEKCAAVPVVGLHVGKVIFSVETTKGGEKITLRVVEILNRDGEVTAHFLTSMPVDEKPPVKGVDGKFLDLKPERNA